MFSRSNVACSIAVAAALLSGCAEDEALLGSNKLRDALSAHDGEYVGQYQALVARGHDGSSWIVHRAVIDGVARELEFDEDPGVISPKSLVGVWGDEVEGKIRVDDFEVLQPPPAPLINADAYEPRKLATVILHWGTPEHTKEDTEDRMWNADYSTLNYWAEISYGKETMTGDVFGPYEVSNNGCSTDWIASAAKDQMSLAGIDPAEYDQFMYVFPQVGCGWGGLAMLGYPNDPAQDSWYNGSFNCVVRNQEIAHNYGIMHTRFYDYCTDNGTQVPFSGNCNYQEYGSPYDPMGGGCGHMATPDKHYMGWLEECNVVTATSDGTFNILPSEVPCNGTQALRVPTFDGRYYYIEYRQPIGFDEDEDDEIRGVLVHVSRDPSDEWEGGPYAYLIDLGVGGFLATGESYADPGGTVTFTVEEEHDTHAVVSVIFPGETGAAEPTCIGGAVPEDHGGVWGSLECTGGPFQPDAGPPVVSFTQPMDGAEYAPGDEVEVVVSATDDVFVSSVALFVDDQAAGTASEAPYSWTLPVISNGTYQLIAIASDGINETEASITIKVTDNPSGDGGDGSDDSGAGEGGSASAGDDDAGDDEAGAEAGLEDDALPPGFGGDGAEGCGCRSAPGPSLFWLIGMLALARRRFCITGAHAVGDAPDPGRSRPRLRLR